MSNVVQFLEALARSPKPLSRDEFIAAVMRANLDPAVQAALLGRDVVALHRAMNASGAMCCLVFPADNEEPKEGEEQPQEDGDEAPQQEPSSIAA
ncbi:hypothetical protein [Lysobacter terrae]